MPTLKKVAKVRIVIDLDGGNSGPTFAIDAFGGTDDDAPSFRCNSLDGPNMMEVLRDVFSKATLAFGSSPGVMLCTDGASLVKPGLCGSGSQAASPASPAVPPAATAPAGAAFHAASAALQAAALALQAAAMHTAHAPSPAADPAAESQPPKRSKRGRKRRAPGRAEEASEPEK